MFSKLKFESFLDLPCFGLHITEKFIRIADSLGNLTEVPCGKDKIFSVKKAVKQANLRTPFAAISIPEKHSFIKFIAHGGDPKRRIRENIPIPIKKLCYDTYEHNNHLFIAAGVKKIVDEYIEITEGAGLVVTAIEPASLATARNLKPKKGFVLIIDVESAGSSFIISSSHLVYFTAFRSKESLPGKDQIVLQALEYINFFEDRFQKTIDGVVLSGEELKIINLENLEEKIGRPVKIAKEPAFNTAIGLSKRPNKKQ
jgi:Tfp pilus assembly PilM family ATPase